MSFTSTRGHPSRRAATLAPWLVLASGCAAIAGLDEDVRLDPAGAGGAVSAGGGGSGTSVSTASGSSGTGQGGGGGEGGAAFGCADVGYPLPPGGADVGGDLSFVVAVREVLLADQEEVLLPGLNIDKTCTCPGASSCLPRDGADPELLCDGAGGIDVQSNRLFGQIALLTSNQFSSGGLSNDAEAGRWSLLMRVEGWTGEPDDARVRFTLFPSPGFEEGVTPQWDGQDAWLIDERSLGSSGQVEDALYVDPSAYVVGGKLVASLPQTGVVFATGGSVLALEFSGAFLVATLVREDGLYGLRDGVLAAVWPSDRIFEALDGFRDGNGDPLCTNNPLFSIARNTICDMVDVFDGLATPTSPCDALSVGIGFSADEATLGGVAASEQPTPGCDEAARPSSCKCGDEC
jgi:hypothetical protein